MDGKAEGEDRVPLLIHLTRDKREVLAHRQQRRPYCQARERSPSLHTREKRRRPLSHDTRVTITPDPLKQTPFHQTSFTRPERVSSPIPLSLTTTELGGVRDRPRPTPNSIFIAYFYSFSLNLWDFLSAAPLTLYYLQRINSQIDLLGGGSCLVLMRRCLCLGRHYDQSSLAYLLLPLPTASLLTFSFISNGDYSLSLSYSRIYTPPFPTNWVPLSTF